MKGGCLALVDFRDEVVNGYLLLVRSNLCISDPFPAEVCFLVGGNKEILSVIPFKAVKVVMCLQFRELFVVDVGLTPGRGSMFLVVGVDGEVAKVQRLGQRRNTSKALHILANFLHPLDDQGKSERNPDRARIVGAQWRQNLQILLRK